jgi:hypothetical protein
MDRHVQYPAHTTFRKTQGILRIIKWFIIWLTELLDIMFKGKTLGTNLHKHGAKQMCNRNGGAHLHP